MKTDHAARNETHKSSPPRGSREGQREKDTRETEKEGRRRYRSPRGVSPSDFRNKNPSVEGMERGAERGRKRPSVLAGIGQKGVARLEKHEISIKETSLVMRQSGFIGSRFTPWRQNVCVCSCSLRALRPARAC